AVRAEQAEDFTGADLEREIVERHDLVGRLARRAFRPSAASHAQHPARLTADRRGRGIHPAEVLRTDTRVHDAVHPTPPGLQARRTLLNLLAGDPNLRAARVDVDADLAQILPCS